MVVLASHLGRPKGKPEPRDEPGAGGRAPRRICSGQPVAFAADCVGPAAQKAVRARPAGGVVLLENLRFHAEEEKNDAGVRPAAGRARATST